MVQVVGRNAVGGEQHDHDDDQGNKCCRGCKEEGKKAPET